MTIPYTTGIPASSHAPSADQPLMMVNNDNNSAIWAIDHITFGTALLPNGMHKQVTFPSNNVPATPVANPVLFTSNDAAGVPQLLYYTGTNAQSVNQYVPSANGSVLCLGGIVIKWGTSGTIGSPVSFAVAFPNNCFVVLITGTSTLYTGGFVVSTKNVSNFTVNRTSGSGSTGYSYIAIGN